MAEGVPTNNQRGRRSGPCRLWGGLDKARHIVPTALLVSARFLREIWISYFARRILEGVFVGGIVNIRNECLFFSVHGKWIAVRNKQIAWTTIYFSRFMENKSQCGTNKSHENRFAVHAICLFRTAIHFPWTEKKRHSFLKKITFSIYTCIYISFTCCWVRLNLITSKTKKEGAHVGLCPYFWTEQVLKFR